MYTRKLFYHFLMYKQTHDQVLLLNKMTALWPPQFLLHTNEVFLETGYKEHLMSSQL